MVGGAEPELADRRRAELGSGVSARDDRRPAVPWTSSCMTGWGSSCFSRRSISKHSGIRRAQELRDPVGPGDVVHLDRDVPDRALVS